MYQFSYGKIVADSDRQARARERDAFDRIASLLREAAESPHDAERRDRAVGYLEEFWRFLLRDLAHAQNGLPDALKASLVSIGLWMLKEADGARTGDVGRLADMADINEIIRDGLN